MTPPAPKRSPIAIVRDLQPRADRERRVLGALVLWPERYLPLADALELDDFAAAPAHAAIFAALRNVVAKGTAPCVAAILDELEATDWTNETAKAERCAPVLRDLVTDVVDYAASEAFVEDLGALREVVDARRAAIELEDAELKGVAPSSPRAQQFARQRYLYEPLSGFVPAAERARGERARRMALAARRMSYGIPYLDDVLRVILPHDLILLGAETGLGKTEIAIQIAVANVHQERRVAYFALEAEPHEIETREKHRWLAGELYRRGLASHRELPYVDWYLGDCDDLVTDQLDAEADAWIANRLDGLITFYRGEHFDAKDLAAAVEKVHRDVDLIIVDHLHYVDEERENEDEHRGLAKTMKTIRDVVLRIGKPVLAVAHLRKKDARLRQLVPAKDDFHGSSNLTKIATQIITLAPASDVVNPPKWYLSPTFVCALKDRRGASSPLVALTMFDKRTRRYEDTYTLGRLLNGRTKWEQLKATEHPTWARSCRQLELDV